MGEEGRGDETGCWDQRVGIPEHGLGGGRNQPGQGASGPGDDLGVGENGKR